MPVFHTTRKNLSLIAGGVLFISSATYLMAAAPVITISSPGSSSFSVHPGATISLAGTVSDDGLPNPPAAVTTSWSMVSGPAAVVFGDAGEVNTTAKFSTAGSYVIRLSADDGQDTTTKDIAVQAGGTFSPVGQAYGGATGSHTITDGVYRISNSAGSGIEGGATNDGFYAIEQQLSGDFDISCRVDSATDIAASSSDYERVGLVIRGGATAAAGNISSFIGYDSTSVSNKWGYWVTRSALDGVNSSTVDNAGFSFPRYVRLARVGNTVTGYLSADGVAWDSKGTMTLSGTARVGLAWASDSLTPGDAQFSDLTFTGSGSTVGNMAPLVNAGVDVAASTSTVALSGSVSDDGLPASPGTVSTTWSVVSGAGNAVFSAVDSASSDVTFSQTGSYTLRLTATDGDVVTVDDVVVSYQLNVPGNPYAHYISDSGVIANESGVISSWSDFAGNTSRNLTNVIGSPNVVQLSRSGGGSVSIVNFDGTSGLWAPVASWGSIAGNRTVVAHCRVTGSGDGFLFDGSTGSGKTRAQVNSGSWQAGVQSSGDAFTAQDPNTTAISPGDWQTHVFTFTESAGSTQVVHYIDNAQVGAHSVAKDTSLGGLILASNGATSGKLAYQVSEMVVYSSVLSSADRDSLQSYMTASWGDVVDIPFSYASATTVQTAGDTSIYGVQGIAALELQSNGNADSYALTNVSFNLNGTTDLGDIEEVRLYTTRSKPTFDTNSATQLASIASPGAGSLSFSVKSNIQSATEYFWIAAKLSGDSDVGDLLDAEITSFTINGDDAGSYIPTITSPAGAIALTERFFSTIVRNGGDDGSVSHRIPGLVTTNAGTLIAVFDIRYNHAGDLPANIDVGIERSTDGGFTWGPLINIMDYDSAVVGSQGNGVGDPTMLVDRATGRIWCAALWSKGNNGWNGSGPGLTEDETGQFVVNYSDDDGLTWSEPVSITNSIKDPSWNLYFNGPGKGFSTREGTLIIPAQYRDSGGTPRSNFIYSVDHGANWVTAPPAIASGNPWTTESQMVELDSGDLLISMRNHAGNGQRLWCVYSWDHATETIADGSWGIPWYDQIDPVVMGSVDRYRSTLDGHPYSALLFSNPDSNSREKMTIRVSLDEGATWAYKRKIDDRPAAYSCLTILPDGDIGIFYETGANSSVAQMEFARFPIEWIVGDTDSDADGIPDFHEDILGLNKNDTTDAALDPDGDGQSNLDEYRAQTNPHQSGSVLKASVTTSESGGFQVEWPTTEYTKYRIETSSTLDSNSWTTVPGMDSIRGDGGKLTRQMPASSDPRAFYRIRVL